jgi:transposase
LAEHVKKTSGRRLADGTAGVAPEAPEDADTDLSGLVCKVQVTTADGGYPGSFLDSAQQRRGIAFQAVQRRDRGRRRRWLPPDATPPIVSPFAVVPRRWVVERTSAWLGRNRRLSKDYEFLTATSEAVICLAMTRLLLRRLTRP